MLIHSHLVGMGKNNKRTYRSPRMANCIDSILSKYNKGLIKILTQHTALANE